MFQLEAHDISFIQEVRVCKSIVKQYYIDPVHPSVFERLSFTYSCRLLSEIPGLLQIRNRTNNSNHFSKVYYVPLTILRALFILSQLILAIFLRGT